MSTLFLENFVTFLLRPRMATLQPAFAEATACQAEVLTTDRPTPSAFVPQSRDYGVIDFTDNADGIRRLVSFAEGFRGQGSVEARSTDAQGRLFEAAPIVIPSSFSI